MGTSKSYYQQLKPYFEDTVTHYKDDFLVHDRAYFRKHKEGAFLCAMRECGTDMLNLEDWDELSTEYDVSFFHANSEKEHNRFVAKTWMTTYNKRWFHGVNGIVTEITKDDALAIIAAL